MTTNIAKCAQALAVFAFAAVLCIPIACSGINPHGVRVRIGDTEIAPNQVDRVPFWSLESVGLATDMDNNVYIQGWVDNPAGDGDLWRIYRKPPDGDWEVLVEEIERHDTTFFLRERPGTSEIYAGTCDENEDGANNEGPLRLYRVTDSDGLVEVSGSYWSELPPETLAEIGVTQCAASWAVHPDGSILLATKDSIWKVRDGQVEVVLADITGAMDLERIAPGCELPHPSIRVNSAGDVLFYFWEPPCHSSYSSPQPTAFRLTGSVVGPVLSLGSDSYISDVALGPDGAGYFLVVDFQHGEDGGTQMRGIRGTRLGQSDFLWGIRGGIDTGLDAISINDEGRMYVVYGSDGPPLTDSDSWLIGFSTDVGH